MTDEQLRQLLVDQFGLRIQPQMTQYVRQQLERGDGGEFPVIGADARTGAAVRKLIAANALHPYASRADSSSSRT